MIETFFSSAPVGEGVGLLRELRHLRAASRPPSLYLRPEESPLESSAHHNVDDGAEKGHEGASACVEAARVDMENAQNSGVVGSVRESLQFWRLFLLVKHNLSG